MDNPNKQLPGRLRVLIRQLVFAANIKDGQCHTAWFYRTEGIPVSPNPGDYICGSEIVTVEILTDTDRDLAIAYSGIDLVITIVSNSLGMASIPQIAESSIVDILTDPHWHSSGWKSVQYDEQAAPKDGFNNLMPGSLWRSVGHLLPIGSSVVFHPELD